MERKKRKIDSFLIVFPRYFCQRLLSNITVHGKHFAVFLASKENTWPIPDIGHSEKCT
jgi:hypothetical protein